MSKITEKVTDVYDFFKDNEQDINILFKETNDMLNAVGITSTSNNNTYTEGVTDIKDHIIKSEAKEYFENHKTAIITVGVISLAGIFFFLTRK